MRAHHVAHGIEQREQELRALATIMERIEREPANAAAPGAPRPRACHGTLPGRRNPPAGAAHRHPQLGPQSDFRADLGAAAAGHAAGVCREPGARAVDRRSRDWLAAVAEYEALSALATYAAEHPEDPFPEIAEGGADVRGRSASPIRCCRPPGCRRTMSASEATRRTCCW